MYASVDSLRSYLEQVPDTAEQRLTITGATGGNLVLGYDGTPTANIPWPASARSVATALNALDDLEPERTGAGPVVQVQGRRGGPYHVTFGPPVSEYAELLTVDTSGLTGTGITATVEPWHDGLLRDCLTRATAMIDERLGFRFAGFSDPEPRRVEGVGGDTLWLPPHEPGSVTAITHHTPDGSDVQDGWEEIVPDPAWPFSYLQYPDAVLFPRRDRSGGAWRLGWGYYVTARWGYGDAPESIVQMVLEVAVNIWRLRDKGMFQEMGAEDGGFVRYLGGLNKTQEAILRSVRDRLVELPL